MTRLRELYARYLTDGTLSRFVGDGIPEVTANPTTFASAIEASDAHDDQFASLVAGGRPVEKAYWRLVTDDIRHALDVRPRYASSGGHDGFFPIEPLR